MVLDLQLNIRKQKDYYNNNHWYPSYSSYPLIRIKKHIMYKRRSFFKHWLEEYMCEADLNIHAYYLDREVWMEYLSYTCSDTEYNALFTIHLKSDALLNELYDA
jgi:hypothetical protein